MSAKVRATPQDTRESSPKSETKPDLFPTNYVVSQQEWIEASKALLEKEKDLMRAADALSAARRALPMVRVDRDYAFTAAAANNADADADPVSLSDLFDGMDQLIVYHFMFAPGDARGCRGCAHVAECLPDARHLRSRRTQLVCVSRAAPGRLAAWREKCGWTFPWYSTARDASNQFNRDFYVSVDQGAAAESASADAPGGLFNFRGKQEMEALGKKPYTGEYFGFSVFVKNERGEVFHTYSTYGRGVERVMSTFALLDITPLGRQDEPAGPGAFKVKYEYEQDA